MSARFWTAAEIHRGLGSEFAADKRPAVLLSVNRTRLSRRSARAKAEFFLLNSYFSFRCSPFLLPYFLALLPPKLRSQWARSDSDATCR